jgi:hypothetical protein
MGEAKRRKANFKKEDKNVIREFSLTCHLFPRSELKNPVLQNIYGAAVPHKDWDGNELFLFILNSNQIDYEILLGTKCQNSNKGFVFRNIIYCGFGLSKLGLLSREQKQKAQEIKERISAEFIKKYTGSDIGIISLMSVEPKGNENMCYF